MVFFLNLKTMVFLALYLKIIKDFLANSQQRAVLNGKARAGVPQGSVLGPLFFLLYINDLVDNISSEAKLFADDTSLFTVVYDADTAASKLNRDLKIISTWAYQWKMQFNPDKNKQAIQVIFSQKKICLFTLLCFSIGLK